MAVDLDTELYASAEQRDAFRREIDIHNFVRNFEVTLRRKDGAILTALESSFATRDSKGNVDRYLGSCSISRKRNGLRMKFAGGTAN